MNELEAKRQRVLEAMATVFRRQGKSPRTTKSYRGWVRRFFAFYPDLAPEQLREEEIRAFLDHLVMVDDVSESTHNQALCALKALYTQVYRGAFPWFDNLVRARRGKRDPEVLNRGELQALRAQLKGSYLIIFYLLFGSGLRLGECMRLRIRDLDLNERIVRIRGGKGNKDRRSILAEPAVELLSAHLPRVLELHQQDLERGAGHVALPHALSRKYPNASREWGYQWVFPATRIHRCRETGQRRRHHLHESAVQRRIKRAVRAAGITKKCTAHTLRHSFATHFFDADPDPRKLKELMGHKDIRTTMMYARLRRTLHGGAKSPADDL